MCYCDCNSEQQELARVLQERSTVDNSDEVTQLQDELSKIETKLTNKVWIIKTQSKNHKRKHSTMRKRSSSVTIPPDGEVEVVTTVKPKKTSSPHTLKLNRKLLYNMKTLQDTLQRDDLTWNYIYYTKKMIKMFIYSVSIYYIQAIIMCMLRTRLD